MSGIDAKTDYILGDTEMELGEQLGTDLFALYLVKEIDKVQDELDKGECSSQAYITLMARKDTLEKVREAYYNLKN